MSAHLTESHTHMLLTDRRRAGGEGRSASFVFELAVITSLLPRRCMECDWHHVTDGPTCVLKVVYLHTDEGDLLAY